MLCLTLLSGSSLFQNPEYNLKAAFLYRFLDYVEWEGREQPTELRLVVLGDSDIFRPLIDISRDSRTNNRKLRVRQYFTPSDISNCDILFISRKYRFPTETVINKIADQQTLIITETGDDFSQGAHINFMIQDSKLKFAVNLRNTSRSGIKISSQLLQHAVIIKR